MSRREERREERGGRTEAILKDQSVGPKSNLEVDQTHKETMKQRKKETRKQTKTD